LRVLAGKEDAAKDDPKSHEKAVEGVDTTVRFSKQPYSPRSSLPPVVVANTADIVKAIPEGTSIKDYQAMSPFHRNLVFGNTAKILAHRNDQLNDTKTYAKLHNRLLKDSSFRQSFTLWLDEQPNRDEIVKGMDSAATNMALNAFGMFRAETEGTSINTRTIGAVPHLMSLSSDGTLEASPSLKNVKGTIGDRIFEGNPHVRDFAKIKKATANLNERLNGAYDINIAQIGDGTNADKLPDVIYNMKALSIRKSGEGEKVVGDTGIPLNFRADTPEGLKMLEGMKAHPKVKDVYLSGKNIYHLDTASNTMAYVGRAGIARKAPTQ